MRAHLPDAATLASADHDHPGWFFGAGGCRPCWLGYTLNHRIVSDWLVAAMEVDADRWVNVPAEEVLAAARGHTLLRD